MLQHTVQELQKNWGIEQDAQLVALRYNYFIPNLDTADRTSLDTRFKPQVDYEFLSIMFFVFICIFCVYRTHK